MKECLKCGAAVPDDGVFCPVCGSRADGKQDCPNCGRLIDEGAVYCTYCGERTDGKKKCPNCGELADGDFCPKCGAQIINRSARNTATPATAGTQNKRICPDEHDEFRGKAVPPLSLYQKIANIVSPALMLTAVLTAFICSFFVGAKLNATSGGSLPATYSVGENMSAMYFFGDCYKNLKTVFAKPVPGPILAQYIVATMAAAAGIITSFVMLVVAAVKFGKSVRNKKYVNLTGHAAWSMGIVALAAAAIYCQFGVAIRVTSGNNAASANTVLNGAALTAIILPLLLIVAAITVKRVACGKKALSLAVLGKSICAAAATIFAIISLVLVAGNLFGVTQITDQTSVYELNVSAGLYNYVSYYTYYLWWNSVNSGTTSPSSTTAQKPDPSSTVAFVTTVALIAALAITIAFSLIAAGKKKGGAGMLACSIVSLCAAIVHLVVSILLKNYLLGLDASASSAQTTITLSIAPSIAALVLTVITLAASITALVFRSRRKRDCANENT